MTEPFVSYAQHGEDVILWRALGGALPRFYVDVGAYDPSDDSVTRALYERGWRGLNIEPQRDRIAAFERDRPEDVNLALAVGATERRGRLHVPDADAAPWATLVEDIANRFRSDGLSIDDQDVEVRTLAAVFRELGISHVDVLKVDVEGSEPDVIRGLDLDHVRPTVVVIEGVAPHVGRAAGDEAVELLVQQGYTHCMFDGLNHYLTCDPDLVEALSLPANPIDNYVRAAVAWLREVAAVERDGRIALMERVEALEPPPPEPIDAVMAAYPVSRGAATTTAPRRQAALRELIEHPPRPEMIATSRRRPPADLAARVAAAVAEPDRQLVIAGLYRAILRRDVDDAGLASWLEVMRTGVGPVEVAHLLAASPEAGALGEEHHRAATTAIETVAARTALLELARSVPGEDGVGASQAARAVLVYAVFDVCLGRPPTADELAGETARLARGFRRNRLIALYARHPDAWARNVGASRPGLIGRVQRRLGRRRVTSVVRRRVAAGELRRVATIGTVAADIGRSAGADRDG